MNAVYGWSCDERDRKNCRNGHGCHCREITSLMARIDDRDSENERLKREAKASAALVERVSTWLDEQIAEAKAKQTAGFKIATPQRQLAAEKAHSRQCALYEVKQKLTEGK